MTNQEIIAFIEKNLKGQGTAVDLSGKLPQILSQVLQQIVDMTSTKVDKDTVKAAEWIKEHPTIAKYLGNYNVAEYAQWNDYLTWLAAQWASVGSVGHIDVPWGPNEMVSIIGVDTAGTGGLGGVLKLIRNGKIYLMKSSGAYSWSVTDLGGGGGESNVFVATYGTTTYNEIGQQRNAGKIVMLYNSGTYELVSAPTIDGVKYWVFHSIVGYKDATSPVNKLAIREIRLSEEGVWSRLASDRIVFEGSLASTIDSSSTNSQAPSAKAVWDLVSGAAGGGVLVYDGTTSYEDIDTAFRAGKLCVSIGSNGFGIIIDSTGTELNALWFNRVMSLGNYWYQLTVNTRQSGSSTWSFTTYADLMRRDTYINNGSTDFRFPTSKAVWDLVKAKAPLIAYRDVTSYSDISAAFDNNQLVILKGSQRTYILAYKQDNSFYFLSYDGYPGELKYYLLTLTSEGSWTDQGSYRMEIMANKTTELSHQSTNVQYPAAKTVYDYYKPVLYLVATFDSLATGSPISASSWQSQFQRTLADDLAGIERGKTIQMQGVNNSIVDLFIVTKYSKNGDNYTLEGHTKDASYVLTANLSIGANTFTLTRTAV